MIKKIMHKLDNNDNHKVIQARTVRPAETTYITERERERERERDRQTDRQTDREGGERERKSTEVITENGGGSRDLASRDRIWTDESSGRF